MKHKSIAVFLLGCLNFIPMIRSIMVGNTYFFNTYFFPISLGSMGLCWYIAYKIYKKDDDCIIIPNNFPCEYEDDVKNV